MSFKGAVFDSDRLLIQSWVLELWTVQQHYNKFEVVSRKIAVTIATGLALEAKKICRVFVVGVGASGR